MTATLAHHHSHHGHRRKKRHSIYGMVPGPFGFQLLNERKNGRAPEPRRGQDSEPESEQSLKARMAERVWSLEGLLMVGIFLLFSVLVMLYQVILLRGH